MTFMAKSLTCPVCGQVVEADASSPGIAPKFCEECGSLLQPVDEAPISAIQAHNIVITIHSDLAARREIANKLVTYPEVLRVWLLSGNGGILAFAKVRETEDIQSFVDRRVASLTGVKSIDTCLILKELKKK
jgi:DNA-binding Lrp family transcriptional regulator